MVNLPTSTKCSTNTNFKVDVVEGNLINDYVVLYVYVFSFTANNYAVKSNDSRSFWVSNI